ncbi:PREDICTED: odorant receptor 4-like [Dinoponera quadriceps]|uniref:Odorant receptor n=1 Tax=Dinoponera quadriceps TaxID=609295 RepID=A0A6P3XPZ1_DINQU|nr:PREDICTED: odorant receptor 4-like [Dinoponera quadriceps]
MTHKSTINRTTKVLLILCGIWPGTWCMIICRAYWIIALATDEFCHYRYLLIHWRTDDLFDLADCFSSFIAQIKLITKFSVFWLNQRKFVKMLTMMAEDWHDSANSDIGTHETTCKAKLSGRITNAMVTLHGLTIVAYSSGIILADVDVNDRENWLPLLLRVEVPIDIHSQLRYKALLAMQFVYLFIAGCAVGLVNALLLTLILHVGGQMDILRWWLTELVPKENERKRESVVIMTNKIIQKHQKIIVFSQHIEDLYTYITLVHFASNTLLICTLGFLIVTSIGSPDATEQIKRSLLFYTVTTLEAFIFCFAGEYLKNKSKEVGTAAYNSAWYELKPENSRILILVILRAQKQLTLTVGKMMDLSLESFTSIMKASGSYMSVLLAMQ